MSVRGFGAGRSAALISFVVAASIGGGALAQDAGAPSSAGAMAGAWEFSNADHDKVCRFIFRTDAAGPGASGYRLDIDRNCPNIFPSTRDIVAWAVDDDGALRLIDAHDNVVIELTEAESGIYDGFQPGEGRYVLQSAAAAPMAARTAADMVGDWAIARGTRKPVCLLTLADHSAGADNLTLKVKPGCDSLVTRFAPASWRLDQGDLVLFSARGQTWRFEENDANTWQRVPETPDPILLLRQ